MCVRFLRSLAVAAFLGSGLTAASVAQSNSPSAIDALRRAPPHSRDWVLDQLRRQQVARTVHPLPGSDVTPPLMTAFDVRAAVDVSIPESRLVVAFKITDDLSGARSGFAWATSPSGQDYQVSFWESLPAKRLAGQMVSFQALSPFMEPGTYTFTGAHLTDVAGNGVYLDQFELAALGNITFIVKNKKGFDVTKPELESGAVQTPVVSLSAKQAGTDQLPFAGISVTAIDKGNTAVSGVRNISALYCHVDGSNCMDLVGSGEVEPRQASLKMRLGRQLLSTDKPGDYRLHWLQIYDYAANGQILISSEIGGSTDFSRYFPSTTITITP
jgi:hypothetical protein